MCARGRFFNVIDLVNRLEAEARNNRQGRLADYLTRMDFIVLDELGYLPFAQAGGQLDRPAEARAALAKLLSLSPGLTVSCARQRLPSRNRASLDMILDGLRNVGLPD